MSIISQLKKKTKIQTLDDTKCQKGNGATGTFIHCHCECTMVKLFGRQFGGFLQNYKHTLNIRPSNFTPWYLLK